MLQKTETQVVKYDISEAAIAQMKDLYMDLTITDLEDKEQFKQVKEARLVVKGHRVSVEKKRKELKAEALSWGRKVDNEAKRIKALLEPIETHLQNEENKVIEEQKRIEAEEKERERKKIQARIDELQKVNCILPFTEVATMTDEEYTNFYQGKYQEFEEDQKRKAIEAAEKKAEAERLELQRKEQEKKEAEQKKRDEELAAKKNELENQKKTIRLDMMLAAGFKFEDDEFFFDGFMDFTVPIDDIMKIPSLEFKDAVLGMKSEAEKQMKTSAEKAEKEQKAEAEERKKRESEAKARAEALKPDKEKLTAFAQFLQEGVEYPEVNSDEAKAVLKNARIQIYDIGEEIIVELDRLL